MLQIELVPITEIKPYENNAKIHTREQIEQIKQSIFEFGNNDPIAIDANGVIIEGHGRLMALQELGYTEVEVIRLGHLNEEQRKAYTLIHNKLTMNTGFELDMLEAELKTIENIDMSFYDFNLNLDIDDSELIADDVEEDDFVEVLPEEPRAKLGQVYKLGNHRLMCGDSTSAADVQTLMRGNQADLVFTDPPFGNGLGYGRGQLGERYIKNDENTKVIENIFPNVDTVLKNNAHCLVWIQWRTFSVLEKAFQKYKLRTVVIWDKKQPGLSGGGFAEQYEMLCVFIKGRATQNEYSGNVWQCAREHDKRSESEHPHKKPIEILSRGLKLCSDEGDLVLDLFGGSGSTLIACEQLNRKCYMMEYDPQYVDVIINRWETFTGKKAELLTE